MFGSLLTNGYTSCIRFGSSLYARSSTIISASRNGLCTMKNFPPGFNNPAACAITSSNVHKISCLAIAFASSGLINPCRSVIYGGLLVITSKEAASNRLPASLISPVTMEIFSSRPFRHTLRLAISALSSCISSPVRCAAPVFASRRIGIIPVPVPRSNTLASFFTLANPDNSTASIPKQKRCVS